MILRSIIIFVFLFFSCDQKEDIPYALQEYSPEEENPNKPKNIGDYTINLNNSIFYTGYLNHSSDNNKNELSFYMYDVKIKESLVFPMVLTNGEEFYQWVDHKLYFIQNGILKSYDVLNHSLVSHNAVSGSNRSYTISYDHRFLAYLNEQSDRVMIRDITTDQVLDAFDAQSIYAVEWSPVNSDLLLRSTPTKIYDVNSKSLIKTLGNDIRQFENWRSDGQNLLYQKGTSYIDPYVIHNLTNNDIYEVQTAEKIEISQGNVSLDNKYFGYIHHPRSYRSDFHYLDMETNEDILLDSDFVINGYSWFPSSDSIIFYNLKSFYIYNLSENLLKETIQVVEDEGISITDVRYLAE